MKDQRGKIAQVTGVDDPAQLEEIEEMMRDEAGGTLDHLGPTEFSELARDLKGGERCYSRHVKRSPTGGKTGRSPLYSDGSFDPPVEVKRRVRIDWQRSEQAARSTVKNETVSHLPASPRKSRAA